MAAERGGREKRRRKGFEEQLNKTRVVSRRGEGEQFASLGRRVKLGGMGAGSRADEAMEATRGHLFGHKMSVI